MKNILIELEEYKKLRASIESYKTMLPAMLDTPNLFSEEEIAEKCLELEEFEIKFKSLLGGK